MSEKKETRANTPELEERLIERLRAWLRKEGPRVVNNSDCFSSIEFHLFNGEVGYLDDDTPYLSAKVEEKTTTDDVEGWRAGLRPRCMRRATRLRNEKWAQGLDADYYSCFDVVCFGGNLRRLREAAGMTQWALADHLDEPSDPTQGEG